MFVDSNRNAAVSAAGAAASRRRGRRDGAQPAGEDAGVPLFVALVLFLLTTLSALAQTAPITINDDQPVYAEGVTECGGKPCS